MMSARNFGRRALLAGVPVVAGAAVLAQPSLAGAAPAAAVLAGAVSPADFGAIGDGVADDTQALNDALTGAQVIDFGGPEKVYRITAELGLDKSAPRVLMGQGATIRAGAPVNLLRAKNAAHTLRGLRFDGNGQPEGAGVIVESAVGLTIERCEFIDTARSAIVVSADRTRIVGCRFDRCGARVVGAGTANYRNTLLILAADHCSVVDNELLNCRWGVYFRGEAAATGINFYECRGNKIVCVGETTETDLQGISNAYGRGGRIENNTIIGFVDNSIDCFGCRDMAIVGNSTHGGKDGVFIGDEASSNITITGNVFSSPKKGVRVNSQLDNRLIAGVVITGNTVSNPSEAGFGVYGGRIDAKPPSQVTGITIADNSVHLAPGAYGVQIDTAEVSRVSGNRIYRSGKEGILLTNVDLIEVIDNTVQDASNDVRNTLNAINVINSDRVLVRDNLVYGSAKYAVGISTGAGMTVSGTRWRSMGTGGLNVTAPNATLADNIGL
ncbi:right-handed parallel beta-helix repeat-containing protein [Micromonospora sp. DT201]|uniref:right-handed parallel beta-helix repeat-containing protein n=1 Tax=Micromonospora sp. DT201 TaxID=3393442 RepID=UPI003CFA6909